MILGNPARRSNRAKEFYFTRHTCLEGRFEIQTSSSFTFIEFHLPPIEFCTKFILIHWVAGYWFWCEDAEPAWRHPGSKGPLNSVRKLQTGSDAIPYRSEIRTAGEGLEIRSCENSLACFWEGGLEVVLEMKIVNSKSEPKTVDTNGLVQALQLQRLPAPSLRERVLSGHPRIRWNRWIRWDETSKLKFKIPSNTHPLSHGYKSRFATQIRTDIDVVRLRVWVWYWIIPKTMLNWKNILKMEFRNWKFKKNYFSSINEMNYMRDHQAWIILEATLNDHCEIVVVALRFKGPIQSVLPECLHNTLETYIGTIQ